MSSENHENWGAEFQIFASAGEMNPPEALSSSILSQVREELNPAAWRVFSKMAFLHMVVGAGVLLFCPQFGVSLVRGMGLMGLFMRFGEFGCMLGCGSVFLGASALVAGLVLRPEEVKVIRRNMPLQMGLLALISTGVFVCLGSDMVVTLGVAWVLGSVLGGLATLELGWRVRSRFRHKLVFGL